MASLLPDVGTTSVSGSTRTPWRRPNQPAIAVRSAGWPGVVG